MPCLDVTGDMVREAMIAAGITKIACAKCATCNEPHYFFRIDDLLFMDRSCKCFKFLVPLCYCTWEFAAKYVNRVGNKSRAAVAAEFGMEMQA